MQLCGSSYKKQKKNLVHEKRNCNLTGLYYTSKRTKQKHVCWVVGFKRNTARLKLNVQLSNYLEAINRVSGLKNKPFFKLGFSYL